MKGIGIILIVLGTSGIGYLTAADLQRHLNDLKWLRRILLLLKEEIINQITTSAVHVTAHSVTSNRSAMHRKTNLLVTSTRSSVCCANLTLGFSVNFVHKKHLAECYQCTVTFRSHNHLHLQPASPEDLPV